MSLMKVLLISGAFLLVSAAYVGVSVSSPGVNPGFSCPAPRPYQGNCTPVVVWAKSPETGICCRYYDPCSAPEGWMTYTSQAECEGTGGLGEL